MEGVKRVHFYPGLILLSRGKAHAAKRPGPRKLRRTNRALYLPDADQSSRGRCGVSTTIASNFIQVSAGLLHLHAKKKKEKTGQVSR
jgi:hypothetical protein